MMDLLDYYQKSLAVSKIRIPALSFAEELDEAVYLPADHQAIIHN